MNKCKDCTRFNERDHGVGDCGEGDNLMTVHGHNIACPRFEANDDYTCLANLPTENAKLPNETAPNSVTDKLPDSGFRREFSTGAVRDGAEGKGRCDLLPLGVFGNQVLEYIDEFMRSGETAWMIKAVQAFCANNKNSNGTTNYFDWLLDYSKHMEMGCQKYGDRNWEKGIPLHCYIDSGVRHYLKFMGGWIDEPHDRAFLWNMFGCLWTLENRPDMNDLPFKGDI